MHIKHIVLFKAKVSFKGKNNNGTIFNTISSIVCY